MEDAQKVYGLQVVQIILDNIGVITYLRYFLFAANISY